MPKPRKVEATAVSIFGGMTPLERRNLQAEIGGKPMEWAAQVLVKAETKEDAPSEAEQPAEEDTTSSASPGNG